MKIFEEFHDIKTPDNKNVQGILASPTGEIALKPLIIFSHGLGVSMHNALQSNAATYFEDRGYNTYRFSYYHWDTGYRKLHDSTQDTHVEDLEAIVSHFQDKEVSDIAVIGHSFGGITPFLSRKIGAAESGVRAIGWDPSHPQTTIFESVTPYADDPDFAFLEGATKTLISRDMITGFKGLDIGKEVADFYPPSLIISAGAGILTQVHVSLHEDLGESSTHLTIPGADHNFSLTRVQDELFSQTAAWLQTNS